MKRIPTWIPPTAAAVLGLACVVGAFVPSQHSDVLAIVGVGLLLQPPVEWAIDRRLKDFWTRAAIQSESFDGVWSGVHDKLNKHDRRLRRLERHAGFSELEEG